MKNWRATILSQYDNSPRLLALIAGFNVLADPAEDIDALYAGVFDPRTAMGWGLDVWGRIVGIGRGIALQGSATAFGFAGSGLAPFGQAPFYSRKATTTYLLADEAYRALIFFKAAINITEGSLASLNRLMQYMFNDRGRVMVLHVDTMRLRIVFDFYLRPYEAALVRREDVPPIPAGVGYETYEAPRASSFGFAGSGLQPFNQGTFVKRGPQDAYSADS